VQNGMRGGKAKVVEAGNVIVVEAAGKSFLQALAIQTLPEE